MGSDANIAFFAREFNEGHWCDFYHDFKKYDMDPELLEVLPEDVLIPLVYLLGEEYTKKWISRPKESLDNKTPIELAKTEQGLKALKAFIMRMPN